mgnify:CR=1 FL=1
MLGEYENYKKFLGIIRPYEKYLRLPDNTGISAFCLPFICADASLRKNLQTVLRGAGIESRPLVSGNLLRQPFLLSYGKADKFPNAETLHMNAFYIGDNQFVNEERLSKLNDILKDFFEKKQ